MAPVTNPPSPIKRSTTLGGKVPELPQLSRKRPHPNDENVSPSSKNSPAKTNISSGLVSIRNYFLPATQVEEASDCSAECPSPKKLRSSGSTTSVAPVSPAGTVSFITSTPKRTPIPLQRITSKGSPSKLPTATATLLCSAAVGSNSPARDIVVDTLNSIINKSSAATKSLLDIFSPLRSSLTRTDSLTQITEEIVEIEAKEEEFENKTIQELEETTDVVQYYEETTTVTVEEAVEDIFNPYRFIKSLPPPPDSTLELPPVLPPKDPNDKRLTLVLDLDETLVHCSTEAFGIGDADYTFDVTFGGTDYHVFARKRPFLEDFFSKIAGKFEVVIFTASQQVYANKLLDLLGAGEHVHHRLFRDSCVFVEGNYLKDLRVLGRDLSRVVIVDNSPLTYGFQIDNGIPIESWYDDDSDTELLKICPFLEKIRDVEDVRPLVRSNFKTFQLVASA